MPSARIISRTETVTVANVLLLNKGTRKTKRTTCTLCGTFTDRPTIIKALREYYAKRGEHFTHVTSWKEETNLYVMSPQEFIERAEKRPLRYGSKQKGGPKPPAEEKEETTNE